MAEEITPEIAKKIAELSRLSLNEEQIERFRAQLSSILDHAAEMDELDLKDLEPTSHPYPLKNVLREDEVALWADSVVEKTGRAQKSDSQLEADAEESRQKREEVLKSAPQAEDNQFRVPPILGSQ